MNRKRQDRKKRGSRAKKTASRNCRPASGKFFLTIKGHDWYYTVTSSRVHVHEVSTGKTTMIQRKEFHGFSTVTPQDVKRFILNGLKPVDYTNDHARIHWQKIEDGLIFVDDEGKPFDPADGFWPEHAKLDAVKDKSQVIGEFLDWLLNDRPLGPITLCERHPKNQTDNIWIPFNKGFERLLSEYFEIDEKKLEAEKLAILEAERATAEKKP